MTKPKYTDGPWLAVPTGTVMQGYSQPVGIIQKDNPNLIAGIFGDVQLGKEGAAEANAALKKAGVQ